jgi:hypothetical protein
LLPHSLFKAVQLAQQDLMRRQQGLMRRQQGLPDDLQRRMARTSSSTRRPKRFGFVLPIFRPKPRNMPRKLISMSISFD